MPTKLPATSFHSNQAAKQLSLQQRVLFAATRGAGISSVLAGSRLVGRPDFCRSN